MKAAIILLGLLVAGSASAQTGLPPAALADTQLPDPRQEAEARALMEEIRCLVCAGQSIADSDASMAGDMRALVRERIAAGESADAVRDWLIARYGDAVSYDPPLSWRSAPLWIAPIIVIGFGLWLARGQLRRRR